MSEPTKGPTWSFLGLAMCALMALAAVAGLYFLLR
jgi:hypothetical protein